MSGRFTGSIALVALMAGCSSTGHSASREATNGAAAAPKVVVTQDDGSLPARCGVRRSAARVAAFIDASNRGDAAELDRLIADRRHFQWYSSNEGHGKRARSFTADGLTSGPYEPTPRKDGRPALLRYLATRYRSGERMRLVQVKIARVPPRGWFQSITDDVAGVDYSVRLEAPDLASYPGRNRLATGKAGFGCSDGRLLAWSMGLDTAAGRLAHSERLCRVASRIKESAHRVVACTG
jgi:hypothetical protein